MVHGVAERREHRAEQQLVQRALTQLLDEVEADLRVAEVAGAVRVTHDIGLSATLPLETRPREPPPREPPPRRSTSLLATFLMLETIINDIFVL